MQQSKEYTQFVLMNKDNGEVGVGIKVWAFDDNAEVEINDDYKVALLWKEPTHWAISGGDNSAYVLLPFELVDEKLEILSEL